MSASMLLSCVGVATHPGLCQIAKKTAEAAPTLCTEYGPNGWMDLYIKLNTEMQLRSYLAHVIDVERHHSVSTNRMDDLLQVSNVQYIRLAVALF